MQTKTKMQENMTMAARRNSDFTKNPKNFNFEEKRNHCVGRDLAVFDLSVWFGEGGSELCGRAQTANTTNPNLPPNV